MNVNMATSCREARLCSETADWAIVENGLYTVEHGPVLRP